MITVQNAETPARVVTNTGTTSSHAGEPAVQVPAVESRPKSQRIRRDVTEDKICVLTFDRPDSSANIFDRTTLVELHGHLDAIEKDSGLRGLVLTSAKNSIFIAGADLHSLSQGADAESLRALIEMGLS